MTKLLTIIFLSVTLVSYGQTKQNTGKSKEQIDKVCDTFMQKFAEGKIDDALQLFKQNSVMTSSSIDTLQVTIKEQMNSIFPVYGKMLSSELVAEKRIKDFISKRYYILKLEIYYLRFDFTLYKTTTGWAITNFTYDEELTELLY